jgi:hypothetical protein
MQVSMAQAKEKAQWVSLAQAKDLVPEPVWGLSVTWALAMNE